MIVLYVLGYFNRNKQNSYAALTFSVRRAIVMITSKCQSTINNP